MKVALVINPASGRDFPILAVANRFFVENNIQWDAYITKKDQELDYVAVKGYDAAIVYGGAGTACKVLTRIGKELPILILQGGTANILAKELGIPQDPREALELLKRMEVSKLDSFTVNGRDAVMAAIRSNMLTSIIRTGREEKEALGQLAYVRNLLENTEERITRVDMDIDGQKISLDAAALIVTNISAIPLVSATSQAGISSRDGMLDLIIVKDQWGGVLGDIAGKIVDREAQKIEHLQGKEIMIRTEGEWNIDDRIYEEKELIFRISDIPYLVITA